MAYLNLQGLIPTSLSFGDEELNERLEKEGFDVKIETFENDSETCFGCEEEFKLNSLSYNLYGREDGFYIFESDCITCNKCESEALIKIWIDREHLRDVLRENMNTLTIHSQDIMYL